MRDFDFLEPATVGEACALLANDPEGSAVFAGGTDILVDLKAELKHHRRLISLGRIEELRGIELAADGALRIGAMVTINMVARHEGITERFPGIHDAAMSLAAEQVRNQATVAGNLCMAVPSADMAPILLAHDAAMKVISPTGERMIRLREFFVGPRQTILDPADVVVGIHVSAPAPGTADASFRQGGRVSLSLPIAAAAAVVLMEGSTCREASVALGAVAPTPILAKAAGQAVAGRELTLELLVEAGDQAAKETLPIDDLRATKEYRMELVRVLTRRVLAAAAVRAGWNG